MLVAIAQPKLSERYLHHVPFQPGGLKQPGDVLRNYQSACETI